jgi:hypothetical protein
MTSRLTASPLNICLHSDSGNAWGAEAALCWNIKCDLTQMSKPDYSCCAPFPGSHHATMLTPHTFIIVANISFCITALLLLSSRAVSFVHLMQLGYFTFSISTTLENLFSPQLFGYRFAYQH